jgi:bile acid:Na+ symporter, BASS family
VSLASLIGLLMKTSIVLTVFALALGVKVEDLLFLFRRPRQLLTSLLAMNVVMPLVAVTLALTFDLHPAVKIALVALALSPVPPVLPRKIVKAAGSSAYAFGLLVTAALFSILYIPLALEVIGRVFALPVHVSATHVALIVLISVLAPLTIGVIVKRSAPAIAQRIARPLSIAGAVLLVAAAVPILFSQWREMLSLIGNGTGTLAALTVFIVAGLAVGHLLGGPGSSDRTVLALCTAARHPGVALAIASANFPQQKLVLPEVLLYLIVSTIIAIPYSKWRQHSIDVGHAAPL